MTWSSRSTSAGAWARRTPCPAGWRWPIEAAESLVDALAGDPSNRVAVVAFAGRGVVRYPLTENLGAVKDVVRRLRPGAVQPGGTDLGAGLDVAMTALGQEEHADGRAIVIFSDGEDHAEHWRARLDRLAQAGVIVHGVAVGDAEAGHPVPTGTPGQPLTYQGEQVLSRRVDTALEAIAQRDRRCRAEAGDRAGEPRRALPDADRPRGQAETGGDANLGATRAVPALPGGGAGLRDRGLLALGAPGSLALALDPPHRVILLAGLVSAGLGAGQGADRREGETAPAVAEAGQGAPATAPTPAGSPPELVARGDRAYAEGRFAEALTWFEAAIPLGPSSRSRATTPRRPCSSSSALKRLASDTRRLENVPAPRCGRRSTTPWGTWR